MINFVRQQKKNDCFSACVSMITGIDLDLLPVAPPANWRNRESAWLNTMINDEEMADYLFDNPNDDVDTDAVGFERWQELMAFNGYVMEATPVLPPFLPAIRMVPYHAVVIDKSGKLYDPASDDGSEFPNADYWPEMYITIKEET